MFRTYFTIALISTMSAAMRLGNHNAITDTACTTVSGDGNVYHLSGLARVAGDEYMLEDMRTWRVDAGKKKKIDLTWNYCQTITPPDGTKGVYAYEGSSGSTDQLMATKAFDVTGTESLYDDTDPDNVIDGIVIVQEGGVCPYIQDAANTRLSSLTTTIKCDADAPEKVLMADVVLTADSEWCQMTVTFSHPSGCRFGNEVLDIVDDTLDQVSETFDESLGWLYENEWCIGVIYLIAGPLIAIFGVSMFPYIVASLVAIFMMGLVCGLALAFGWMASTGGTIAVLCVAVILGVLAGCLVRRRIKWMLGVLGLISGFFAGGLIFALISAMAGGWTAVWAYYTFSALLAIVGCVLAIYIGLPLVMICTSFAGSYLFMRSWTLFFPGNWPSEAEMMSAKDDGVDSLEMTGLFWLYFGIFIVSFACTLTYQCKKGVPNKELDDHFQSA